MGALSRSRQAERFRAVVVEAGALNDVDPGRLEAVIQAYEDGSVAVGPDGEYILDTDGNEVSESDVAKAALTPQEVASIEQFCGKLRACPTWGASSIDAAHLLKAAETAVELPGNYGQEAAGMTAANRLLSLIDDIIDSIP